MFQRIIQIQGLGWREKALDSTLLVIDVKVPQHSFVWMVLSSVNLKLCSKGLVDIAGIKNFLSHTHNQMQEEIQQNPQSLNELGKMPWRHSLYSKFSVLCHEWQSAGGTQKSICPSLILLSLFRSLPLLYHPASLRPYILLSGHTFLQCCCRSMLTGTKRPNQ